MASKEDPVYLLSDTKKAGYIRVRVEIQGMKAKKPGVLGRIAGEKGQEAKNATIECDFHERGFKLVVQGDGKLAGETFERPNLPYSIDAKSSYWETENNFVNIFLKKVNDEDDWGPFIDSGKLESE